MFCPLQDMQDQTVANQIIQIDIHQSISIQTWPKDPKKDLIKEQLMLLRFSIEFPIFDEPCIHWWIWWCPWNGRPIVRLPIFLLQSWSSPEINRVVLAVLHFFETFWAQRFLVGICQNHPGICCLSWRMTGMLMSWWGPRFVGNKWFLAMRALHFMPRWLLVVKIMRPFFRCFRWHGRNFMALTVINEMAVQKWHHKEFEFPHWHHWLFLWNTDFINKVTMKWCQLNQGLWSFRRSDLCNNSSRTCMRWTA